MNDLIKYFEECCQSKSFQLFMILFINLGSVYLSKDIKFFLDYVFSYCFMKFIIIFAIAITVTKDFTLSLCAAIAAGILLFFVLNKESKFCLLPNAYIKHVESFYQEEKKKTL